MGKIPNELREIIARNIRDCRLKMFPGRGGGKKCAEKFGVSPQQWSPWERGKRTPDEDRMKQIAKFFDVTVAYLREDHSQPDPEEDTAPTPGPLPPPNAGSFLPPVEPPSGGSDTYWMVAKFLGDITSNGLRIRLSTDDMNYISKRLAEALLAYGVMYSPSK